MQHRGDERRAAAKARARIARELHPDVGGDPVAYLAAMDELEGRFGRSVTRSPILVKKTLRGRVRATSRRLRRRIYQLQRKRQQRVA